MAWDVIIIGAGPAGLSAAVTLRQRNKNVLAVGANQQNGKVAKSHEIYNYLGFPNISGSELAKQFHEHAIQTGVEFADTKINTVYALGDSFSLQTSKNEMLEAGAVIIATGVNFGKPLPGEEAMLGRGVSYCATCDGALYRRKDVCVIGQTAEDAEEVKFLAEICSNVIYIPQHKDEKLKNAAINAVAGVENIETRNAEKIEILGDGQLKGVKIDNETLEVSAAFILRDAVSPAQLVPGLEMDGRHIKIDRNMATNIPGLFACGDVIGQPYQIAKAVGGGNIAALSAVKYLSH